MQCSSFVHQLVHVWVSSRSCSSVLLSAMYAKCTRVGRRPLWKAMENISSGMNEPWMAASDFNVISSAEE